MFTLPYLREPRLLRQVKVELLEIVPKLQIFPDKVKITFNKIINRKNYRFRISRVRHLGFYDVTELSLMLKAELLLFATIGQHSDVTKSKMAARGKFKSDN